MNLSSYVSFVLVMHICYLRRRERIHSSLHLQGG